MRMRPSSPAPAARNDARSTTLNRSSRYTSWRSPTIVAAPASPVAAAGADGAGAGAGAGTGGTGGGGGISVFARVGLPALVTRSPTSRRMAVCTRAKDRTVSVSSV